MAVKSNYLKSKLLRHALGIASFTMPTTAYLALYTTDPTGADSGTEVTGGSYSRKAITFGTEANGTVANSAAINFTSMPATTVVAFGIRDASTGGNLLYFGTLPIPVTTVSGNTFSVLTGNLTVTEV